MFQIFLNMQKCSPPRAFPTQKLLKVQMVPESSTSTYVLLYLMVA